MYNVTLVNNYWTAVSILGGNQIYAPRETYQFTNWGTHVLEIPGMDQVLFLDLADKKLDAYTNPALPWTEFTWGGLVRYHGLDAYFRYEGQGHVTVTIDAYGSVDLHFDQGGMIVSLDDLTTS